MGGESGGSEVKASPLAAKYSPEVMGTWGEFLATGEPPPHMKMITGQMTEQRRKLIPQLMGNIQRLMSGGAIDSAQGQQMLAALKEGMTSAQISIPRDAYMAMLPIAQSVYGATVGSPIATVQKGEPIWPGLVGAALGAGASLGGAGMISGALKSKQD